MDIETLRARRADLDCERIVLTHMGDDVLAAPAHRGLRARGGREGDRGVSRPFAVPVPAKASVRFIDLIDLSSCT